MKRITIKEIFASPEKFAGQKITVAGWARTIRASNVFGFIELNDGSFFKHTIGNRGAMAAYFDKTGKIAKCNEIK